MARRPSLNKKNMEAIRKICTEDLTMGCGYVFNINTADQWYPVYYHEDTLIVVLTLEIVLEVMKTLMNLI